MIERCVGNTVELTTEIDMVASTIWARGIDYQLRHPIELKSKGILVLDLMRLYAWRKKEKRATLTKLIKI